MPYLVVAKAIFGWNGWLSLASVGVGSDSLLFWGILEAAEQGRPSCL